MVSIQTQKPLVKPQAQPQVPSDTSEEVTEEISEDLKVTLPGKNLPLPVRLIAFFTLGGGVSIIGALFIEDILRPLDEDLFFYVVRIFVGLVALVVGYGIVKQQRWAIWLYGGLTVMSAMRSPFFALIPGLVVLYLYTQRRYFKPTILDTFLGGKINSLKSFIKSRRNPQQF